MTYGKCAAYGREWSQGQHCCYTKGPSITTWICPSTGWQQQEGLGSPTSLAPLGSPTNLTPHRQIHSISNRSNALRERDVVQLIVVLWVNASLANSAPGLLWPLSCDWSCVGWMRAQAMSVFPQSECYQVNSILNWHGLVESWLRCSYPALQSAINPPFNAESVHKIFPNASQLGSV